MKKTIKFRATVEYEVEVDFDNEVVQEYKNDEEEIAADLVNYGFGTNLPLIATGGAKLINKWIEEIAIIYTP